MKGRPAKPIEVHQREGTGRADRGTNLPVVLSGRDLPARPAELTNRQLDVFDLVVTDLSDGGVLDRSDRFAIEAFSVFVVRAREAAEEILDAGMFVDEETYDTDGNCIRSKRVPNPAVKVERDSYAMALRFGEQLGLSPSARARLGIQRVVGMTAAQRLQETLSRAADDKGDVAAEVSPVDPPA